jgi:hypothetical protein
MPEPVAPNPFGESQLPVQLTYANSANIGISNADISIIFMFGGRPAHIIALSHQTAKALGESITKAISQIEKSSGVKIVSADEMAKRMKPAKAVAK